MRFVRLWIQCCEKVRATRAALPRARRRSRAIKSAAQPHLTTAHHTSHAPWQAAKAGIPIIVSENTVRPTAAAPRFGLSPALGCNRRGGITRHPPCHAAQSALKLDQRNDEFYRKLRKSLMKIATDYHYTYDEVIICPSDSEIGCNYRRRRLYVKLVAKQREPRKRQRDPTTLDRQQMQKRNHGPAEQQRPKRRAAGHIQS